MRTGRPQCQLTIPCQAPCAVSNECSQKWRLVTQQRLHYSENAPERLNAGFDLLQPSRRHGPDGNPLRVPYGREADLLMHLSQHASASGVDAICSCRFESRNLQRTVRAMRGSRHGCAEHDPNMCGGVVCGAYLCSNIIVLWLLFFRPQHQA